VRLMKLDPGAVIVDAQTISKHSDVPVVQSQ
jgi:hypothetical protein